MRQYLLLIVTIAVLLGLVLWASCIRTIVITEAPPEPVAIVTATADSMPPLLIPTSTQTATLIPAPERLPALKATVLESPSAVPTTPTPTSTPRLSTPTAAVQRG